MRLIFTSILLLFWYSGDAQIILTIDNMIVNKVNPPRPMNRSEGLYDGPYLVITCLIQNNTDSTIQISPPNASIYLRYRYKGELYSIKNFSIALGERNKITLNPNDKAKFDIIESIFLGTDIIKENEHKLDYTFELLQVLPTVKIMYKENGLILESTETINVKVNND